MAAITGVLYLKKFSKTPVKYFIYFLVFIAISEIFGAYNYFVKPDKWLHFLIGTKLEKNHWWTNIYWVIGAIMFFSFYYINILETQSFKKLIKVARYSFLTFSIIYVIVNWQDFFNHFFIVLNLLGAVIIFLCAVLFFVEILLSEKVLVFYKNINFYISATIFIWWLIISPMTFYDVYYEYEIGIGHFDKEFLYLRRQVFLFANIFMYLTYTFAFIWCKPENEL
nr:hypothetical protein [Hyunsoonleella ulvae]